MLGWLTEEKKLSSQWKEDQRGYLIPRIDEEEIAVVGEVQVGDSRIQPRWCRTAVAQRWARQEGLQEETPPPPSQISVLERMGTPVGVRGLSGGVWCGGDGRER
ncbi:hypothetical protein PIB30_059532 [Stylosanthes scabra]|uniref:Uncharacterized protein n=1 Tax=Stylosanthes scabra TaxID=79078 RepID=A0ABU6SKA3_9FABA|nr:hypothetical protein [Stylosanthes scabra]